MRSVLALGEATSGGEDYTHRSNKEENRVSLWDLARISMVAAGVQFEGSIQTALLTPYAEEVLGIRHVWASYLWLCGPIAGIVFQPLVGHLSDKCESFWGRRRPFIVGGAFSVSVAAIIIGFSADLGYALGDSLTYRPRAIVIFLLGFWILDFANNAVQGPCRALLADFTGKDHRRSRLANAFFSLFMAVGNVLGYATGAYGYWYKVLPFTMTYSCEESCANLKSSYLLAIVAMFLTTTLSVTATTEIPWSPVNKRTSKKRFTDQTFPLLSTEASHVDSPFDGGSKQAAVPVPVPEDEDDDKEPRQGSFFWELIVSVRNQPKPMRHILLLTALTWFAWYPFVLYSTDWMGREVFLGDSSSTDASLTNLYNTGVNAGSFGLMLNSIVLGITSLLVEPVCRVIGQRNVWASANVIMFTCFVGTAIISVFAQRTSSGSPSAVILWSALAVYAILGAPFAVTFSVPFALTATVTHKAGGGQGLSMAVLNLALVLPQLVVALGAGPWDELFGGSNLPAFLFGAMAALAGSILAVILLPKAPSEYHPK